MLLFKVKDFIFILIKTEIKINIPKTDDFKSLLKQLGEDEGQEFLDVILTVFKERISKQIEDLEEGLKKQQYDIIGRTSHTLVGTLGSMNFKNGTDLAVQVEQNVKHKDTNEIEPNTNRLITYLKKALKET